MLVRVVLYLPPREQGLIEKLQSALSGSGVDLDSIEPASVPWELLGRRGADLVVEGRDTIPPPEADSIRLLVSAPEAPATVSFEPSPVRPPLSWASRAQPQAAVAILPKTRTSTRPHKSF